MGSASNDFVDVAARQSIISARSAFRLLDVTDHPGIMDRILPPAQQWPLHNVATTRNIEANAASALDPHTLMRRAGEAVARLTLAVAPHARRVWVAAGPGNNGGDGLEAAACLQSAGKQVQVTWLGAPDGDRAAPTDALDARNRAQAAGVQIVEHLSSSPSEHDIAIDALLGIGATRPPTGLLAASIARLNAGISPVLAVDLPSGLAADTGRWLGDNCVRANHTLTLLTMKPGLFTANGRDQAGEIWFDALGVVEPAPPDAWLSGARARTPPHRHIQHKGSFDDVAVIGGTTGMAGAALLAARAAHAAGAGRVFIEWLQDAQAAAFGIDGVQPELMMRPCSSQSTPSVLAAATVVCGCGAGDKVRNRLPRLLSLAGRLILDADALNAVASDPSLLTLLRARSDRSLATVLTPHPLEAARLLSCDTASVQSNRLAAARALTDLTRCVVVLKGSGTITAAPDGVPHINGTGNGSLASGGTGDVLAGWIGGRWAQSGRYGTVDEIGIAFATASQAVADHGAAAEPMLPGALPAGELIRRLQHDLRHGRPSPRRASPGRADR